MPALCKRRGKMRWRGKVIIDGKTKATKWFGEGKQGGKEYKKAVLWEEVKRKELLKTQKMEIPTTSLTIRRWINAYLNDVQRRYTRQTYNEKRAAYKSLKAFIGPDEPVENITMNIAHKTLQTQYDKRSGYAANKDRKNLTSAWNWGSKIMDGFPDIPNPFQRVPKYPEIKSPRYVPPETDFWKVYNLSTSQDRLMLTAFLHLAARRGEIFRLKWQDIDWHNNQVRLSTRKTRSSSWKHDWIPMTKELKQELLKWHQEQPVESEYVFVCINIGDKPKDNSPSGHAYYGLPFTQRRHFMHRMCKQAKVPDFGFHAIRHLSATILYKAGYKLSTIQRILRHESPSTTERYLKSLGFDNEVLEAVETFSERQASNKVIRFPEKKKASDQIASEA